MCGATLCGLGRKIEQSAHCFAGVRPRPQFKDLSKQDERYDNGGGLEIQRR